MKENKSRLLDKRDITLDTAKGLLIIFVLMGHFCADYNGNSLWFNAITNFIYIFHMPCFLFISGYLSKSLEKNEKKALDTFLDFVLFEIIWIIFCIVVRRTDQYLNFLVPGAALWYVLALSFYRLVLKNITNIKYNVIWSLILGVLIITIDVPFAPILGIPRIIGFLPFFLLGYYFDNKNLEKIKKINVMFSIIFFSICFGLSIYMVKSPIDFLKLFSHNYQHFDIMINNKLISLAFNSASYLLSFISIFFFINIASKIKIKFISNRLGKNTLPIYILSNYIQWIYFLANVHFVVNPYIRYVLALMMVILTLIVCSNKYIVKYFNWVRNQFKKLLIKKI